MKTQSKIASSLFSNWVPKVFSFCIAVFIVLSVRFMNIGDRVITIPLEVTLPSSSLIVPESLVPETVDIVITGSDSIIYLVEPSLVKARADFSIVTGPGIARVPVVLDYNQDIYTKDGLTISSKPSSVRILFKEAE